MNRPDTLGVYIHTPFCVQKCNYCDFYSTPGTAEAMDAYTDALIAHIRASAPRAAGRETDTVYFGGGTPTVLGAGNLVRILNAVLDSFPTAPDPEITLEANPGDLCLHALDGGERPILTLAILRAAGFNRISFGIQSSDEAELRLLGRRHSFESAAAAVLTARCVDFENITLDLMYGLPGQTMDTWRRSLSDILSLAPEHISCYGYQPEPGTPLWARRGEIPPDEDCLEQYLTAVETLEGAGYRQYEISNFARPGMESRHNSRYWSGAAYLGFGPAAHSFDGGIRWAWANDTAAYTAGEYREKEHIVQTPRDRLEEWVMLSLRTASGLDPDTLPPPVNTGVRDILTKYLPHGLVRREGSRFILTPRGMFVSNTIISELFETIPEDFGA